MTTSTAVSRRGFLSLITAGAGIALVGPLAGAADAANDYPYASDTTGGTDPWYFTKRQCVSFCAWRAAQAGRPMNNSNMFWGNATNWPSAATKLGYRYNSTPTVGSFAHWGANEKKSWSSGGYTYTFTAGPYGHVAYVAAVYSDGTVLLEDYNAFGGSRVYGTKRMSKAGVGRFIHYIA